MKKLLILLVFSFYITTNLFAKTLEEKKEELKKIYEAGGISKIEYKKSVEFLEKPEEKEKKSKIVGNINNFRKSNLGTIFKIKFIFA